MNTLRTPPLPYVPLHELLVNPEHPAAEGLFYPHQSSVSARHLRQQCHQLHELSALSALGVEGIYDADPKTLEPWLGFAVVTQRLGRWHGLGLGYRGVVLLGQWQGQVVALKLLRSQSQRSDGEKVASLLPEAEALQQANRAGVGPTYRTANDHCIVMDWVVGDRLIDWVYRCPNDPYYPSHATVRLVLVQLADMGFRLDQQGLDHGELNCVASHVIVPFSHNPTQSSSHPHNPQPVIIDFSQASQERRPANVTALVQGLLIGTSIPKALARRFGLPKKGEAIARLRAYKREPSEMNFVRVRSLLECLR